MNVWTNEVQTETIKSNIDVMFDINKFFSQNLMTSIDATVLYWFYLRRQE